MYGSLIFYSDSFTYRVRNSLCVIKNVIVGVQMMGFAIAVNNKVHKHEAANKT
jgi:hypothetical protein